MKNIILFICLFLITVLPLHSQTYAPFPTQDSTTWRINFYNCDGPWECTGHEDFDFIMGDTILKDKLYSRLYRSHYGLSWDDAFPKGYIREEDKRIYYVGIDYYSDSLSHEVLLYDFNLGVGDTMYWDISVIGHPNYRIVEDLGGAIDSVYVDAIDSVQVNNGEYRKRFRFQGNLGNWYHWSEVVEGIGSSYGFLRPNYLGFESVLELLCVSDQNALIYNSGIRNYADANACLYNPVSTEVPLSSDLKIFPNPTNEVLYFSKNISETLLEIYTPIGVRVFDIQNFTGNEIDISHLASGMYFMVLGNTEKRAIKVVKN